MNGKDKQFGKFHLLRKIATGGMGEIFLARHVDQPPSVPSMALKRILAHHAKDPHFVRLFLGEAKVIAQLKHPNLVRILDFGKEQDNFYMTMEHVEGVNVDKIFSAACDGKINWGIPHGLEVLRQALLGMGYAHKQVGKDGKPLDITHLDLKPHNLMVNTKGVVKILDFGISHAAYRDDQKLFTSLRGTYAYLSPEQCREEPVDPRSDLFTLGILLYELTTRQTLFRKQPSEFMTLKAITDGLIPPPSNQIPDYPPELEKIVYKALEVDKTKRYQSAEEFLAAIAQVVAAYQFPTGEEMLAAAVKELMPPPVTDEKQDNTAQNEIASNSETAATPKANESGNSGTQANQKPGLAGASSNKSAENPNKSSVRNEAQRRDKKGSDKGKNKNKVDNSSKKEKSGNLAETLFEDLKEGKSEDLVPDEAPVGDTPEPKKEPRKPATPAKKEPMVLSAAVPQENLPKQVYDPHARKLRFIWSSFAVLMLISALSLGFYHFNLTRWMAATAGSPVYLPTSGKLLIETMPQGAKIKLDGKEWPDRTPLRLDNLAFGKPLKVELSLDDYAPIAETVTLTREDPLKTLVVEMKRL